MSGSYGPIVAAGVAFVVGIIVLIITLVVVPGGRNTAPSLPLMPTQIARFVSPDSSYDGSLSSYDEDYIMDIQDSSPLISLERTYSTGVTLSPEIFVSSPIVKIHASGREYVVPGTLNTGSDGVLSLTLLKSNIPVELMTASGTWYINCSFQLRRGGSSLFL